MAKNKKSDIGYCPTEKGFCPIENWKMIKNNRQFHKKNSLKKTKTLWSRMALNKDFTLVQSCCIRCCSTIVKTYSNKRGCF